MDENSIFTKIFYKKDAYTGRLRISKTIVITLVVFILMFFFVLIFGCYYEYGNILPEDIIVSIIAGLFFALPTLVIGWIIGYFLDNHAYKSKMESQKESDASSEAPVQKAAPAVEQKIEPVVSSGKLSDSQINQYIVTVANTDDPLVFGDEYECQMEYDALKSQGNSVIYKIEHYLKSFAMNLGPSMGCDTWYYGGKNLVRLLGDINTEESLGIVAGLFSIESNIAEWYWKILNEAAIVLGNTGDEKYLDVLRNALNHSMAPADRINEAIDKITANNSSVVEESVVEEEISDVDEVSVVEESVEDSSDVDEVSDIEEVPVVEDTSVDDVPVEESAIEEETSDVEEPSIVEEVKDEDSSDSHVSSFNKYM